MPGPKIDDEFWFAFPEGHVNKAQERQEQAADKIQNLVLWLWGIYTALATVGFALAKKNLSFWPAFLIAAASAALIAVYWGTVWVRMPLLVEFDPRSPTDIMHAYARIIRVRDNRLKVTVGLSILAGVTVSLSLVIASMSKESQEPKAPTCSASVHFAEGRALVAVTAAVGKTKEVKVDVTDTSGKGLAESGSHVYVPTDEGLVQASIPICGSPADVVVTVEWEDTTGMKLQLSRNVPGERKSKASK